MPSAPKTLFASLLVVAVAVTVIVLVKPKQPEAPGPADPAKTPEPEKTVPPVAVVEPVAEEKLTRPEVPQEFSCDGCNLVMISLTNLRADHLGVYGYSRDTSPNIDALARESLVFDSVFSHASWTLPVAISLFTSMYPLQHGLMNRKNYVPVPAGTPMFIDALKAAGYVTGAFVGDRDYSPEFGHTSRFHQVYDSVNDMRREDWHEYGVFTRTIPKAISWIQQNKEKKFFAFVQAYDVHCPFAIPEANDTFDPDYKGEIDFTRCYWTFGKTRPVKIRTRDGEEDEIYLVKTNPEDGDNYEAMLHSDDIHHMIALYDGEILSADAHVGKLLQELRDLELMDKTVVIVFSEHGDMLGKHGRFMRGGPLRGTFYDDVLKVPLILRHPTLRAGRTSGLVELIDLAPTILDLLGLPAPETFVGRSLRPLILDGESVRERVLAGSAYTPKRRSVFFRTSSLITSVRTEEWKLIHEKLFTDSGPKDFHELFHVGEDPGELEEVAGKNPAVKEELQKVLDAWLEELGAERVISELNGAAAK